MEPSWLIQATKYDQRLHYTLPAQLIDDDGERLHLFSPLGTTIDHRTRGKIYTAPYASDAFFWRNRWYNVFVDRNPDGTLKEFYCNISLPPTMQDHVITFVDLDLDVQVLPDGTFNLLDADEFREHSVCYSYPPDVHRAAWDAVVDVLNLWRARQSPFDQT